jgi:GT2 family glycosyltransferase
MAKMFPMTAKSPVKEAIIKPGQPFTDQKVDIIIPFYGQYDRVAQLVSSLIYCTRVNLFRICIVDDCSPNEDFIKDGFDIVPNLKIVRNEERLGFGASLEVGANALAKEPEVFPWLVFMHSDCRAENHNWLIALGQTMLSLKGQGVKLVSALTNNPVHSNLAFQAKKKDILDRADVILNDDDYAPLHCAMCHRDLFKYIGGFIKHYPYAGFEDKELAARMRYYGYKQAISGRSWVYHEGDATMQYIRRKEPEIAEVAEKNEELYKCDLLNLVPQG